MRKFKINKKIVTIIIILLISVSYLIVQNIIENRDVEESIFYGEDMEIEENIDEEENIVEDSDVTEAESEDVENEQVVEEIEKNMVLNVEDMEKIYVYVTGEVNNPGVAILNKGSRIVDAINAAGGATNKADISKVNLVFVLEDGMKVNIPNVNEFKKDSNFEYITKGSGDGRNDELSNESQNFTDEKIEIVNINTATQTELETLPGIGPSLALNIINYRNENGKFSSIEDIKNVSGIGESKFNNIKDLISV